MKRIDRGVRVAVTGLGIVCSIGRNRGEVWESILESRSGISEMKAFEGEEFPTSLAAEVIDDLQQLTGKSRRELKRLSRTDRLAIIAAGEALQNSEEKGSALNRAGVFVSTGTSTGGLLEGEDYFFRRLVHGRRQTPASLVLQQPTSGPSDAVARIFGLGGGVISNATACASGGGAIGIALDLIRSGHAETALAGGADALCRLTYSGFNVLQAVDDRPCMPFDKNRKGITLGEGAAYLVLERLDRAVARGAAILAEVGGYGYSCDAYHPTAPAEDGRGAAAAMRWALEDSGVDPGSVHYVNAHGTGTVLNDSAETAAIRNVLGTSVPVSSTKSFFGHTLGASGALEAVVSVMALTHQTIPPTLRLEDPIDDSGIDYVPNDSRRAEIGSVLSNTFGFGGSNVAVLFKAV